MCKGRDGSLASFLGLVTQTRPVFYSRPTNTIVSMSTTTESGLCVPSQDTPITPKLREYSCLRCAQRKVKCDRNDPCSHCNKSRVECVFVVHAPSRRRKRRLPEEDLLAKLKRYEELLKSHGVEFDDHDGPDMTRAPDCTTSVVHEGSNIKKETSPSLQTGKLILEHGESRYVDK